MLVSFDKLQYFLDILITGILAYLLDAFHEKEQTNSHGITARHNTLRLHPVLAPVKVAILSSDLQHGDLCLVAQQLDTELRQAGNY